MRKTLAAIAVSLVSMQATAADVRLDALTKGQTVNGFQVEALYADDAGRPMGGRFLHLRSGFTLDLLQIESVPQGYTWINSIPVSDQGEPHTQEHLLLGKGTKGRSFAGLDTMWLSASTAFTQQWRTSYHFNTAAGPDVFFNLLERQLDAMLHPNYTDEEIRREVRNFGVTRNPDGTLRLEEKGSVYNEMVSSTGNPYRQLFRAADHLVYGPEHPLAYNSGGEPSGIRTMQPKDIRDFHASTHYLANMGTIASFPKSVQVASVLTRVDSILGRVEKEPKTRSGQTLDTLPKAQPAEPGAISYTEYPHRNEQQPSPIGLWWPASRSLDLDEQVLAGLFFSNFAGDATTNLYKLFIDSNTRKLDIGARQIFTSIESWGGHPIYIAFTDVAPSNFTDERLAAIRALVVGELQRIASFPAGSPELKEFNERMTSRLTELERDLAKFVNSPPGFGFRSGNSSWMDALLALERTPQFKKSLTLVPQLAFVRKLLASNENVWARYLAKWQVTGVVPFTVAARPSPALIQREEAERVARASAESARLMQQYGVSDAQEAIRRYEADYDAASARIEDEAGSVVTPEFVSSPPMTLDDQLQYATKTIDGVPLVVSRFDSMSSAMTGMALRLRDIPREQLRYLSLLPELLSRAGVIENGTPVSFEEMSERLRREVLSLDAFFTTNPRTERVELIVRGSGIGGQEARRAIEWMKLILSSPDWRPENLPRIRDVVDQSLSTLRNTMQGSEESWVQNPATAYRLQHNATFLAANSFLTRAHNALRLRWLLREAPAADRDALTTWFNGLATAATDKTRAELTATLAQTPPALLSPAAQTLVTDVLRDLNLALLEIPDVSLAADWQYLVTALRDDLMTPPATALASLDALRRQILRRTNARTYMVGSAAIEKALTPGLSSLVETLAAPGATVALRTAGETAAPLIDTRLRQRLPDATRPVHAGLFSPNKPGGVIITYVPGAHFSDAGDREKQLDFLASRLHAGYGAHGVFLKTIGAGLAYSNGLRATVSSGRMGYYAERTPELPQTVRFVINELKTAPRDPGLASYAIAQVFAENRAAASYEARAEGIAADLVDNQPPDMVRRFRQSILELRKDPALGNLLFDRKDRVYGRFLPGYNVKMSEVPGGVFFVIGPDKQLDAWQEYLREVEGPDSRLYRLYPRDFWMP